MVFKIFRILPAILGLSVGASQFQRPNSIWFWKFSLTSAELAHLFLGLIAVWLIWALMRKNRPHWSAFLMAMGLVAVFLRPVFLATVVSKQHHLEFSWLKLFTGESFRETQVTTVNYKQNLALDLYEPRERRSRQWIMVVHGGGWENGDRTQISHFNHYLADHEGMLVVALDYRLAPEHHWPAPTQDLADAIVAVQNRAIDLKIDPQAYFLIGRSAGGQIAGELAYRAIDYRVSAPRGLILLYSPTDMIFAYEAGDEDDLLKSRGLIRRFMGGDPAEKTADYDAASPLQHVSAQVPPTLLIHGQNDYLTWFKHSERLDWRLEKAKARHQMILLPWATHGFDFFLFGPGGQITLGAIDRWLRENADRKPL